MAGNEPALIVSREDADERLLVEAAQQDLARFLELYEKNFERVYAYVVRSVRDRDQAEDLTSAIFHKALENLPRYKWRGVPFAAWLFRIAANMIADRAKQAAHERELSNVVDLVDDAMQGKLEDVEYHSRLFRLVGALSADQRRVILMRFADEKSIREIAQELGLTEGAVKQLQFRGLQNLRASIGE